MKISKKDYDKLSYMEQEAFLVRCRNCQSKYDPYNTDGTPFKTDDCCPGEDDETD